MADPASDGQQVRHACTEGLTQTIAEAPILCRRSRACLAEGLGVEPENVTAAYKPEMRQAAMGEILDHPDLAGLDARHNGPPEH